jgi:hypothetical protein
VVSLLSNLLEKRGDGVEVDRPCRSCFGRARVLQSPAAQRPGAKLIFVAVDPPQRARRPYLVDGDALAIDLSCVARRSIEWPTPLIGMRSRSSARLRNYHRAQLIDDRRRQRGPRPQPRHVKPRLRPNQDASRRPSRGTGCRSCVPRQVGNPRVFSVPLTSCRRQVRNRTSRVRAEGSNGHCAALKEDKRGPDHIGLFRFYIVCAVSKSIDFI